MGSWGLGGIRFGAKPVKDGKVLRWLGAGGDRLGLGGRKGAETPPFPPLNEILATEGRLGPDPAPWLGAVPVGWGVQGTEWG